jgi:hypothetical protein
MVVRAARRGWWAPVLALVVLLGIAATTRVEPTEAARGASGTVASSAADGPHAVAVLPTVQERVALVEVGVLGAGFVALLVAARWLAPPDDQLERRSIEFLGAAWHRRGPPLPLSN